MIPSSGFLGRSLAGSGGSLRRSAQAIAGTGGVAAVNLVTSLLLLKAVDAEAFGLFAFVQIAVALGYGISNAVLGSPLVIAVARRMGGSDDSSASFSFANTLLCAVGGALVALIAWGFQASLEVVMLFGFSSAAHWCRWYLRSYGNAVSLHSCVAKSDAWYASVTAAGLALVWWTGMVSLAAVLIVQAVAAIVGCLSAGSRVSVPATRGCLGADLRPFVVDFRQHGKFALAGVLTTEATANAHAYIVTTVLGPAAFAPIAATLLLFRPVSLVIMSLTQVERPRLAKLLHSGRRDDAWSALRMFSMLVVVAWIGNVFAAGAFYRWLPGVEGLDTGRVITALILTALVTLLRCVRSPVSALMQADGEFRKLAKATALSCSVTIPLVLILVLQVDAEWSLLGTLVGEAMVVYFLFSYGRKWRQVRGGQEVGE